MVARRIHKALRGTVLVLAAVLALGGCSSADHDAGTGGGGPGGAGQGGAGEGAPSASAQAPYDVSPLLKPAKKYFGAAVDGAPISMKPVDAYTRTTGKRPNLIEYYAAWGDGFDATGVRNAWASGALTLMSWEPFDATLADIAAGKQDTYLKEYAAAVRKLNLPVVIDFADEMNGTWEKWGTEHATPKQYVAAWRHLHDTFAEVGASNVIWAWSPNVVNPMPDVRLAPYYPGDEYVDWVGLVGYFAGPDATSFDAVFGRTIKEIRAFTEKPMLLVETAAEPGQRRGADVHHLFAGVEGDDSLIGFIWFNYDKRADWRLEANPSALDQFRKLAADDRFGFDVRKPR
ncbi:beta-mannanase [Streptomyces sp. SID8379]|uniref:glycoside hydrolase family 26 protein n=1 Tax=unclassified Streptomyces TaxID=2593676 RepID=UPI0003724EA5|nr:MULTISPECIES: glycosyl hydrolase [unclassified Streptomyces]MYW68299.1 beta-mannanase [Streptomyces sp. SID8379]